MTDTPHFNQQNQTADSQTNVGHDKIEQQAHGHRNTFAARDVHIHHHPETPPKPTPLRTYLSKLPTSGQHLFGREAELAALDDAWLDENIQVFCLIAWGGVGKTALTNRWLHTVKKDGWRGAARVYAWSFYSQGAKEGGQASADEFLAHALGWFGDPEPNRGSPWDKGARLAEWIQQQPTLLILDGLEPLQYPPGEMAGRLKDQGVQALLRELARGNGPGLCLLSSRVAVADVEHCLDAGAREWRLEHLSNQAGAHLLQTLGVKGTQQELLDTAHEFRGHALALNLLGRYLAVAHGGEVRQRDLVPRLSEEEKLGGHARRVLESYEAWLGVPNASLASVGVPNRSLAPENAKLRLGTPEVAILYLMGLFDRPADKAAIDAVCAPPVIEGLTESLQNLSAVQWAYALKHLRDLGLLSQPSPQPLSQGERGLLPSPSGRGAGGEGNGSDNRLDCHPLIREHFAAKLMNSSPSGREQGEGAWQTAHARLYDYFRQLPAKEQPDTLDELEPLFRAVHHGCRAGLHQRALEKVYWPRIQRENAGYTVHKLGAFGADLATVAEFFDPPWQRPAAGLSEHDKASVLNWAGFGLRALGRLREAAEAMAAAVEMVVQREDWENAANGAGSLSELWLALGEVGRAVETGRGSVEYADRSGDWGQKMGMRTTLADALHQAGDWAEAERLFREAEALQIEHQPQYRYLYSLRGYQFCDLLLSRAAREVTATDNIPAREVIREVQTRAEAAIEVAKENRWLLDIALDTLTLGWVALLSRSAGLGPREHEHVQAEDRTPLELLDRAVDGLRESGNQDDLPRGLLARAAAHRLAGHLKKAAADLAEAQEIAERGGMKLYLVDVALEQAQQAGEDAALKKTALDTARRLIAETGYQRRSAECGVE